MTAKDTEEAEGLSKLYAFIKDKLGGIELNPGWMCEVRHTPSGMNYYYKPPSTPSDAPADFTQEREYRSRVGVETYARRLFADALAQMARAKKKSKKNRGRK